MNAPLPSGELGWIMWAGGERPVPPETLVDLRWADGVESAAEPAGRYGWDTHGVLPLGSGDIIAYRVVTA